MDAHYKPMTPRQEGLLISLGIAAAQLLEMNGFDASKAEDREEVMAVVKELHRAMFHGHLDMQMKERDKANGRDKEV